MHKCNYTVKPLSHCHGLDDGMTERLRHSILTRQCKRICDAHEVAVHMRVQGPCPPNQNSAPKTKTAINVMTTEFHANERAQQLNFD